MNVVNLFTVEDSKNPSTMTGCHGNLGCTEVNYKSELRTDNLIPFYETDLVNLLSFPFFKGWCPELPIDVG